MDTLREIIDSSDVPETDFLHEITSNVLDGTGLGVAFPHHKDSHYTCVRNSFKSG